MSNWLFTHDHTLDPNWKPGPGEKYADAPKAKCEVTSIRGEQVYYRYLGETGPAPFIMSRGRWRTMAPVEVQCSDCGDFDILVGTDCCDKPRHDCRTAVLLDGAGDPDVRICRAHHGCNVGAMA